MPSKPRVALVIETSTIYGRRLLAGVTRYLRTNADWAIELEQRSLTNRPPHWLLNWDGDGVICRANTPEIAASISPKLPFIDLTDRHGDLGLTHIWSDDFQIGKIAAEHFAERGYKSVAFCGFSEETWSELRRDGFQEAMKRIGVIPAVLETNWQELGEPEWENDQKTLESWIENLPKPVGIFSCNDVRGQQLLTTCSRLGIAVPEEVAILGADDDSLVCELCWPPLSSVVPNPEAIGFMAAELLDGWMQGHPPKERIQTVGPIGISLRQSSDIVAIDDALVARAMWLIRDYACDGLSVQDLLNRLSVSRSALERRFRKVIHRTPQMEIRLAQLKRVKQLLLDTDLSLPRVAELTGFEHPEYLNVIFKRIEGITPGEYRRSGRSPRK